MLEGVRQKYNVREDTAVFETEGSSEPLTPEDSAAAGGESDSSEEEEPSESAAGGALNDLQTEVRVVTALTLQYEDMNCVAAR